MLGLRWLADTQIAGCELARLCAVQPQVCYCNLLTEISSELNTTVNKPQRLKNQRNRRSRFEENKYYRTSRIDKEVGTVERGNLNKLDSWKFR